MPRLKTRAPAYCLHKASGLAIVTLNGKDHYLGKHGSEPSRAKYKKLIAEWATLEAQVPSSGEKARAIRTDLRIVELLGPYLKFAEKYYTKHGSPTGEFANMKDAVRPLSELYGGSRVSEFGPRALKAVRTRMIENGLSRCVINNRVNRIRRVFKWGVENELVEVSVLHALQTVSSLSRGRTEARETKRIRPVPEEHIKAVLSLVTEPIRAMIEVQRLTGMRPGEVLIMRAPEIDRTENTWTYRPSRYKTEHYETGCDVQERIILIGPRAQEILGPFLGRRNDEFLFSPSEAVETARQRQQRRNGAVNRKRNPNRWPGRAYSRRSYYRAIQRACKLAGIPAWGPNRLRHNAATDLRKEFGIEVARTVLGHRSARTTLIYAEESLSKAAAAVARVG